LIFIPLISLASPDDKILFDEFSVNKHQLAICFCNFNNLYNLLKIEPRLGTALPCRVTVIEKKNKEIIIIVTNLRFISRLFNNDELVELWDEMEETFNDIIDNQFSSTCPLLQRQQCANYFKVLGK